MQGHTGLLKQRIKNRDILITGCIMDSRSGAAVEMYHECGYDILMIDREHTLLNTETILEQIRLARALGLPCLVRAADASYHEMNRMLDQAPDGIFVPRIRSREEAELVVRTVKSAWAARSGRVDLPGRKVYGMDLGGRTNRIDQSRSRRWHSN